MSTGHFLKSNELQIVLMVVFIVIRASNTLSQTSYDLSKQHEELCEEIHETSKLYELRGRLDDAKRLLKIGIEILQEEEGNKRSEAMLKSQLGNILRLQRHFDEALPILFEAKEIAESIEDQKIIGDCLFYIGYLYDHKKGFIGDGDYNRAKDYYEQSLAVRESIGDQRGIGFSLFRIGRIFEMQGDDETAMSYYKRAQKIAEEHTVRNRDASFVAELEGEVVGYMIGYILPGGFGMKKSAWIAMLGVRPKYMGQGIGEQLANTIFEHSKREGIHTIYTSVRWESPDLLSFFKRLGFEKSNFINLLKRV